VTTDHSIRPKTSLRKLYPAEYSVWGSMKSRCLYKGHKGWHNYGGRGITVCGRWINSFENFIADMGSKPTPKSVIDRINNDGNYEPGNCRWTTQKINCRNRRGNVLLEMNGKTACVKEWSEITGLEPQTIWERIHLGWGVVETLTSPSSRTRRSTNRHITHNGETKTMTEWSRITGIGICTIRHRLLIGWSPEEILSPLKDLRRSGRGITVKREAR
jgi:hypothetical protein